MMGNQIFSHNGEIAVPYSAFGKGFDFSLPSKVQTYDCVCVKNWSVVGSGLSRQPGCHCAPSLESSLGQVTQSDVSSAVESISCLLKTKPLGSVWRTWRVSISLLWCHTNRQPKDCNPYHSLFCPQCQNLTLQEIHALFRSPLCVFF